MSKKKRKKKSSWKAIPRGGFVNSKPVRNFVLENVTPANVEKVIHNTINKASKGRVGIAVGLLKKLAKPAAVKIADHVKVKLTESPAGTVTGKGTIPSIETESVRMISGSNGLYKAKEHRVHFKSGNEPGRWLKTLKRDNGFHTDLQLDTTISYPLGHADRSELHTQAGLNQKEQVGIDTDLFGWTVGEVNDLVQLTNYDTATTKEQRAYVAVSKLRSEATITSLNKFVPTYVKMSLVRLRPTGENWLLSFLDGVNTTTVTQIDGAMPLYIQQDVSSSNKLGSHIYVDPTTKGVRSSNKFNAISDIVMSKTIKLPAGDRIKLVYDHNYGSGLRMDKLFGEKADTSISDSCPLTYVLMVEYWGEEVDAYRYQDSSDVIKGTCPSMLQFEFKKSIEGSPPSYSSTTGLNPAGVKGWLSQSFAIKVYTDGNLASTTRRYFGTYAELTDTGITGYRVPIMSDASYEAAGSINN